MKIVFEMFLLTLRINHAYGYDIDRIERRPTLVSLLIFTLSLPALHTDFNRLECRKFISEKFLDIQREKIFGTDSSITYNECCLWME